MPAPHLLNTQAAHEEILENGGRYVQVRGKEKLIEGRTSVTCGRGWIRQLPRPHRLTPLVEQRARKWKTKIPPFEMG